MAAAAQAESADTDRAVVMLAEAVWAAFCAADAAAMLLAAQRVADVVPPQCDGRTAFFALFAQGWRRCRGGRRAGCGADPARPSRSSSVPTSCGDDPRLLAWAAMGSPWLRQAHLGPALGDRALAAARSQSAVGVLPSVLMQVPIGHAASDRWTEALAGFHEAIALARETGQHTELAWALARLALLEARMGSAEQSRLHADGGLDLSRRAGPRPERGLVDRCPGRSRARPRSPRARTRATSRNSKPCSLPMESRDVDLSPAPELVELYLRLGRPQELLTRPKSTHAPRPPRPSHGHSPAPHAAAGLPHQGTCAATASRSRWPCTSKRQTFSKPPARTLPMVHTCAGRDNISRHASNCGPPSTSSTTSAPNRGQKRHAANLPRPVRRPAGETRRPSTSSPLRNCRSRSGLPRAGPPGKPPRRYSSARKRSNTTCTTSTANSPSARGANSSGQ